jgi:hypothetical protein
MSSGSSFLDGLGGFDLAGLLEQLRQAPQGVGPQAAAPAQTVDLNPYQPVQGPGDVDPTGRGTGLIDMRRPSLAMDEGQTQALERAQAGPQDLAALGGSPTDRLLFDRSGFGDGANGFTGTADPFGARAVPMPPSRPSDDALLVQPATTGSTRPAVPGVNLEQAPGMPGIAGPSSVTEANTGNPDASNVKPVASFDPLTGQVVSGSPKLMQAPGMGGLTEGAGHVAAQAGAPDAAGQPGALMQKFAQGLNHPDFSNLMLNIGIGLLTHRGIGEGIGAGLQGYQSSRMGDVKQQLELLKVQQQLQGQQAVRGALAGKGLSQPMIEAAALNPTVLSSVMAQQNKDPSQITFGGNTYLVPPGARPDQSNLLGPSNGPQPGFEADPNNPGGQRPITGGSADPAYKGSVAGAEAKAKSDAVPDKPIQVRPGGVMLDPNTYKPLYTAPGNKPEGFETEDKLRTEFSKQLGTFGQVHDGYGRVIAATKQREANPGTVSPASDIGLIFGYMKMLDPGSVVREGEYATAKNATGVPERVLNAYNKALNGEFLSDAQRKDFLGQAAELYGTSRKTAEGVADRYRGLAQQYGVSPERSVYLPEAPTPPKIGQQGSAAQSGGAPARYQALIQSGMSKADAFAQMHREGL